MTLDIVGSDPFGVDIRLLPFIDDRDRSTTPETTGGVRSACEEFASVARVGETGVTTLGDDLSVIPIGVLRDEGVGEYRVERSDKGESLELGDNVCIAGDADTGWSAVAALGRVVLLTCGCAEPDWDGPMLVTSP